MEVFILRTSTYSVAINSYPGKGELVVLFGGHSQTPPSHQVGPQLLDYFLIHTVVAGKGSFQCLGHDYPLEKGSCFVAFPGELISYASDLQDPWLYRWIGFKGNRADEILASIGITVNHPIADSRKQRQVPVQFHRIEQILRNGQPSGDLQASGILRLILAALMDTEAAPTPSPHAEPTSEINAQIEHAIRWLTLQYSRPISIHHLSQTLGYHRTHFSKMFKLQTGLSPINFLHKIRMERAKLLLLESLTVEQVASSVGFSDSLYFSKQFRKWSGESPTEYRKQMLGKDRFDCSQ
jgi:AraC-like DNA-binding protein